MRKLAQYPGHTNFYFHAWTFGYEDVLRALSNLLQSRVHLDRYRYSIYTSLSTEATSESGSIQSPEFAAFSGYTVGNTKHESILTRNDSVRLHSCEQGTSCWSTDLITGVDVVHIKPIVSRHQDQDIQEAGLGGGHGDLDQIHELELGDSAAVQKLIELCDAKVSDVRVRADVKALLSKLVGEGGVNANRLRLDGTNDSLSDSIRLEQLAVLLKRSAQTIDQSTDEGSSIVTFSYSRHSSYQELCWLVRLLRPYDLFPCTAPKPQDFEEERSMSHLFGSACLRDEDHGKLIFRWDEEARAEQMRTNRAERLESAHLGTSDEVVSRIDWFDAAEHLRDAETQRDALSIDSSSPIMFQPHADEDSSDFMWSRQQHRARTSPEPITLPTSSPPPSSRSESTIRLHARVDAFAAAVDGRWDHVQLQSTRSKRRRSDNL